MSWLGSSLIRLVMKLTFRALALSQSEEKKCGLCEVYTRKGGALSLVETQLHEDKLIKWEEFIVSKKNLLPKVLMDFCVSLI